MAPLLIRVALVGLTAGLVLSATPSAAQRYSGDRGQGTGYTVEEVAPNTPAARAGLRPGDRIMTINGRAVNGTDDIDREMQHSGNLVVVDIERAGRHLRLGVAPRALTRSEAEQYTQRSRRVLGVVHTEPHFVLRPGTGANDAYIAPPVPPEPPMPPFPMIVN
jgi:membrane-associated protease RseP (regulator of RpoE activity)